MAYTIDKYDLKILAKLAAEGPVFMKHASHEYRAAMMRTTGHTAGEMTVYKMHAGRGTAELRTKYTITDAGRALLVPSAVAAPEPKARAR